MSEQDPVRAAEAHLRGYAPVERGTYEIGYRVAHGDEGWLRYLRNQQVEDAQTVMQNAGKIDQLHAYTFFWTALAVAVIFGSVLAGGWSIWAWA